MVVACQQFRARDCTDCTFFLFSATQPVIESSVGLRFACYTLDYFRCGGRIGVSRDVRVLFVHASRSMEHSYFKPIVLFLAFLPLCSTLCPSLVVSPNLFLGLDMVFSSLADRTLHALPPPLSHTSLAGQFAAAKLSVWNNKWSQVYNFTGGGEGDWSCLPHGAHHR